MLSWKKNIAKAALYKPINKQQDFQASKGWGQEEIAERFIWAFLIQYICCIQYQQKYIESNKKNGLRWQWNTFVPRGFFTRWSKMKESSRYKASVLAPGLVRHHQREKLHHQERSEVERGVHGAHVGLSRYRIRNAPPAYEPSVSQSVDPKTFSCCSYFGEQL